jgi:hypothetical protein
VDDEDAELDAMLETLSGDWILSDEDLEDDADKDADEDTDKDVDEEWRTLTVEDADGVDDAEDYASLPPSVRLGVDRKLSSGLLPKHVR